MGQFADTYETYSEGNRVNRNEFNAFTDLGVCVYHIPLGRSFYSSYTLTLLKFISEFPFKLDLPCPLQQNNIFNQT